ncbi:hypothetical protein BIT28_22525 [Photobacterium proteolyticum]|uniref:Molecular chaperone TorD n=1 Tax=Photobacterium proteolyticum TaxID=1903952 RepID=A0A1Q9GLI1_9GAMM|nr:molecular chaperone TorD family protein [Photobacterium proteolyticum]OLQ75418.1 hypothetical protein BIT28_22525 [Photobacterium proteolyticum]
MNKRKCVELRSHTYRLFAGLINQPMSAATWQQLIQWAKQTGESGFLSPVQQWIIEHEKLSNDGLMSMAVDFTCLFTGISQEFGPPPPYEHLYRENIEPSDCRSAVIQCYNNYDFKPLDPYNNVSDHIVAELQYMSFLASQQLQPTDIFLELNDTLILRQQSFLQHHLLSWVHSWCNHVESQNNKLKFYSHVISALICFLEQDFENLSRDRAPT